MPASIIKRLPVRYRYDNNYFDDMYQGIPVGGYNKIFDKLLKNVPVFLGVDFFYDRDYWERKASTIFYTGPLDAFFSFKYGKLKYRSLTFEEHFLEIDNFQGNAVVNYTGHDKSYTRIVEHKHFEFGTQPYTVITKEYSHEWHDGMEPYYPINDSENQRLLHLYQKESSELVNTIFVGRLAEYKYYDMDEIVERVFDVVDRCLKF